MSAAHGAAGRAMRPAAVCIGLCAALLMASAGCKKQGAQTTTQAAQASATAAPAPAVDPALNWGGTTPHDRPPLRDPLIEQADAILRKADPGFDRFEIQYVTGDLDRDGRDDVAVEYGIGEDGAMRHVAKRIRVLLARAGGLELQPDQTEKFADCPALREIRDGRLWADGLEACMLPFPRTLAYYQFEWRNGALVRVAQETAQQRVLSRLQAMRAAVLAGKWATLDRNLRAGPAPAGADAATADKKPPDKTLAAAEPVFADAQRRRAFADALGLLGHLQLQSLNDHEALASLTKPSGPEAGERRLHIDTAPEDGAVDIDGYTYVVDARASLEWPEGDGVGYHLRWRLIEGDLYLEEAGEHDLDGLES
ncbi:hypothetical protein [Lysobacter enzymogenes]|uniref:Lipoprotein n=1 Tax=Lysobacter enzymogenes TaxID=69 RepID=A0AAU9AK77_LYSEN|nr:hypothetical protein [Lysobacter enzymogenes]BAV97774.1 conserved hypothetical protein [Lysobacter enzymogenes]